MPTPLLPASEDRHHVRKIPSIVADAARLVRHDVSSAAFRAQVADQGAVGGGRRWSRRRHCTRMSRLSWNFATAVPV
jgi:hypothetical protein